MEWVGSNWPLNLKGPFRSSRLRLEAAIIEQVSILQGPSQQEEQHGRRRKGLEDNLGPPLLSLLGFQFSVLPLCLRQCWGIEPSVNLWCARLTLPNVLHLQKQYFCSFSVVIAYRVKYTFKKDNLDS